MPITPEENRRRVKETMKERDRINVILPKGTNKRIDDLGFKRSEFAKSLILTELERLEKASPIRSNELNKPLLIK